MSLIQRAIDYERDGGSRAVFVALIDDCLAASDVDGRFFPGIHYMERLVVVGLEGPLTFDQRRALRNDNRHRHKFRLVGFDWLAERARAVARNVTMNTVSLRTAKSS